MHTFAQSLGLTLTAQHCQTEPFSGYDLRPDRSFGAEASRKWGSGTYPPKAYPVHPKTDLTPHTRHGIDMLYPTPQHTPNLADEQSIQHPKRTQYPVTAWSVRGAKIYLADDTWPLCSVQQASMLRR
ncbi:hypothetical protein HYPSUDRAFT_309633 [Hypholoma sublateritium FD-334 SS-4]|uniref:Uncharacterized protein n=1 Tax=Hypholoma sublateritium (strain FD-334 SS-4) TaxID=945553 RepID=A0A0D2PCI6_HYPSF|nr:hypothetical protein HYPSUDRAFT_309633 [Hypholoma sublateritium FD-334 SS-4]